MSLLHYLSYGGAVAAFVFITLSLASGLLWLSELIEEHSRISKSIGQRAIYIILLLHVLLYFSDSLPLHLTLFSMACHVVYLQNFTAQWPMVSLTSVAFLASCVLVVVDHFFWFFHFARITQDARHRTRTGYRGQLPVKDVPGFAEIATFFGVCVWFAPLFLFLSLSANDNALPSMNFTSEGAVPTTPTRSVSTASRGSLFKTLYDALPVDSLPRLRPKPRREASGIIAPPSPAARPVPSPLPSPGIPGLARVPSMTNLPPPRSPSRATRSPHEGSRTLSPNSLEGYTAPDPFSSFSLGAPPKRLAAERSPIRRTTTDGRLEMRRVPTTHNAFD